MAFARYVSPAMLAAAAVGIVTAVALFIPPFIGMADNGDYFRIIYGNGLYFNAPDYTEQYFGYFVKQYGILQYFNENAAALTSSQSLFIKAAMALNKWLYHPHIFDIRVQGALYAAMLVGAVYLLVESVTWKVPRKFGYIIAALAVWIFADTGYTAYFNSFYGESLVYIMSIVVAASAMLLYRRRYNDYVLLLMFFVSALLLTTAKQQNAPVGVIIAMIGIVLIYIRKSKPFRAFAASMLALLLLSGIATYALIPKEFVNINQYHAMTRGPLLQSKNPEETLRAFGIDEQYAILSKTIYYELYPPIDVDSPILEKSFYSRYGFASILAFYAAHPGIGMEMLNLAAKHAFTIRPPAMGNFEKSADRSFGEQALFFSSYSMVKKQFAPKTFGFIVLWAVLIVGLYLPSFVAAVKAKDSRAAARLPLIVMMMLAGLSGIAVSIIGAGDADLAKHEFLFTVMFDIVTFLAIADAFRRELWQYRPLNRGTAV